MKGVMAKVERDEISTSIINMVTRKSDMETAALIAEIIVDLEMYRDQVLFRARHSKGRENGRTGRTTAT